MRIQKVDAFLLSYPLPEPLQLTYYGGQRTIFKRDSLLIRVETDAGIVGYAPGQGSEKCLRAIRDHIGPFLTGHSLADPDALRVQYLLHGGPQAAAHLKYYATVEIALYDALGRHRDLPISELLGGRVRDRIRLYGSGGMYMPPKDYAAEAKAIADLGFTAYKMRPGLGPDEDLEAVRRMRETLGPDTDIMVDAHTWWRMGNRSYDMETVARLAEQLAEYDIYWLEEPVTPDDHDALRQLKEWDIVPIASGEHELDDAGFQDLVARQCVDFVQMDLLCQGGYPSARRLFSDLEQSKQRFAFHCWGTDLEVAAAAQLGICWPESVVEWLEYPVHRYAGSANIPARPGMYPFDLALEILKDRLTIEDGDLIVSAKPGLGVDVDESVIERYPWIPGPWSEFTLEDPPGTFAVTADHAKKWDNSASECQEN